jgi:hypothetical protein
MMYSRNATSVDAGIEPSTTRAPPTPSTTRNAVWTARPESVPATDPHLASTTPWS